MASSQLYFLLSLVALAWPVLSADCKPQAVSLPFKNYPLITRSDVRGVLWQIGGPNPQNITLMPSAYYIDTYLWGAQWGYCPSYMSAVMCSTYRGGLYDRSNSATEKDVANMIAHTFDDTVANWTRDDIKLSDNTSLSQHEFALRTNSVNSYVHKGELGLARTSSFLKSLADASKISSLSYSFFWGNEVTNEPRDGSLTLGGYDQSLIADGANITAPIADEPKCREGIVVNITSLGIQSGGSTQDVWSNLPDLRVCVIASTSNIMTIPGHYWDPIQAAMGLELDSARNGTSKEHFYNTTTVKPASATYTGDLQITLNSASTITIPNNQLLFNEHYIATSGLIQTKTDVKQIPIVRIAQGDGMMPRIGGMFFSAAVLLVNHDKSEFTIAPAQAKSVDKKVMGFDSKNECVGEVKVAASETTPEKPNESGSGTGSFNNSETGSSTPSPSSSSPLSSGAIAGIVIGVLAGLALIGGIAFILWRRKRSAARPSELAAFNEHGQPVEKYAYHASEMYGDSGHEMYVENERKGGVRHELDGGFGVAEMGTNGAGGERRGV